MIRKNKWNPKECLLQKLNSGNRKSNQDKRQLSERSLDLQEGAVEMDAHCRGHWGKKESLDLEVRKILA